MVLRDALVDDVTTNFCNPQEFGETAMLVRDGVERSVLVLFDEPSLNGENIGGQIDAISHDPRIMIGLDSLPDSKPRKKDVFRIPANAFHPDKKLVAKDFVDEKNGMVVYFCRESAE